MFSLLFLTLVIVFCWLMYKGYTSGEIIGRGWGFSTRLYSRDDEPVWYWVTFLSYLACAVLSMAGAIVVFSGP